MSKCRICGRALSNPTSVAAGIGPICAGRNYRGRIMARHGMSGSGWSSIEEWEKVNKPCYSCAFFEFPNKDGEIKTEDGFEISVRKLRKMFPDRNAMGGLCKFYHQLVDGNVIDKNSECKGNEYRARKDRSEQPTLGTLHHGDGQQTLFAI